MHELRAGERGLSVDSFQIVHAFLIIVLLIKTSSSINSRFIQSVKRKRGWAGYVCWGWGGGGANSTKTAFYLEHQNFSLLLSTLSQEFHF